MAWGFLGSFLGSILPSIFSGGAEYLSQRKGKEYLEEAELVPREAREEAIRTLQGLYTGDPALQQEYIQRSQESPLYGAIMGGREAGEQSLMRRASATGGLRSGALQRDLLEFNTDLQNQALLQSYNQQMQGLSALAGLQSAVSPGQIAGQYNLMSQSLGGGFADIARNVQREIMRNRDTELLQGLYNTNQPRI